MDTGIANTSKDILDTKKFMSLQNSPPERDNLTLEPHLSAPFYLHCFKGSESLPYKKPTKFFKPRILVGSIVDENDVFQIISGMENESNKTRCIGDFLLKKKIVDNNNLMEKKFLISLYIEIIDYAAQKDFTAYKLACLLTIYTSAHDFFRHFYWTKTSEIWAYFKEITIRHTLEDSPDAEEVFSPEEGYDILTHFHTIYLNNLPLVHMITFGSYRLKYVWPYIHFKSILGRSPSRSTAVPNLSPAQV